MVSVITAWGGRWTGLFHSPKTNSDRLIEDNLVCYCTFETATGRKKSGPAVNWAKGLWRKPQVLCYRATTPTDSHPSVSPLLCTQLKKSILCCCKQLLLTLLRVIHCIGQMSGKIPRLTKCDAIEAPCHVVDIGRIDLEQNIAEWITKLIVGRFSPIGLCQ